MVVYLVGNDDVSGKISQNGPTLLLTGTLLLGVVKRIFQSETNCVSKQNMNEQWKRPVGVMCRREKRSIPKGEQMGKRGSCRTEGI